MQKKKYYFLSHIKFLLSFASIFSYLTANENDDDDDAVVGVRVSVYIYIGVNPRKCKQFINYQTLMKRQFLDHQLRWKIFSVVANSK